MRLNFLVICLFICSLVIYHNTFLDRLTKRKDRHSTVVSDEQRNGYREKKVFHSPIVKEEKDEVIQPKLEQQRGEGEIQLEDEEVKKPSSREDSHTDHGHSHSDECAAAHDGVITDANRDLIITTMPEEGTEKANICPICGSEKHSFFATENNYNLVKCSKCGVLYLNPLPFNLKPDDKTVKERWEGIKVEAMRVKFLEFYTAAEIKSLKNWLDVGAGNGELLKAISKAAPHIEALGVEEAQHKINTAQEKGVKVVRKPLSDFKSCSFDVVTVMNVLSHVSRPHLFFRELARLVKPGGCIWMSTGNAADVPTRSLIPGRLDLPDHFIFAGKKHLYTIFYRIGFTVRLYKEYKHFWHNYNPLKPEGPFRAIYIKACKDEN